MDIDIDFPTNFNPSDVFGDSFKPASMVKEGILRKHPAGGYFQNIPIDSITRLSAIPYEQAEERGYLKIDFLHLSLLDHVSSKEEIQELIQQEPDWFLLKDISVVKQLFHIKDHFDIINSINPSSIQELADCIALIRPAKRKFLRPYLKNKDGVRRFLYTKPENNQFYFKRGHAIAYACNIVIQLHLIKKGYKFV